MVSAIAFSSAVTLLAFAPHASAHGFLNDPEASFKEGVSKTGWVINIDNFWDIGSGGDQVGKFKTMAKEKGMSVKDVLLEMANGKKCGNTRTDVDPKPIPSDGKVKFLGNGGTGFGHQGPCEVYLDDKMVFQRDNCEDEVPGGPPGSNEPSEMSVDFSSCKGKCTVALYWLAFQNEQWQAYINCVPVSGNGESTTQTEGSKTETSSKSEDQQKKADDKKMEGDDQEKKQEERSSIDVGFSNLTENAGTVMPATNLQP
ncbi:hypothetical protein PHMEG_0008185 [Phytophthora megakarya]|uniref:Uncharacterized protein n=1 Tax=Phytophthora megakarya TaxID=4795 RepID=A0A225WJD6_9STRA|nr:hypothetical protein PHMEG_0008185 [Phytophthora megakarya]